uniref:Uncharacterized protein n=1 Tax=Chromera velia CCMP2878 TaxID=1169474 RepID=A0A0K6S725_9ALVE|eukprot:Cvel_20245.t1-p1 / transcript=Cvel_20245.t1 / gene=Cvel_20245 / organism=Chromera_velia_CCMP2878 / gene_product=hypothetical protein / transcript_product=hypothetical protein / location=Cvel_scaffold1804:23761-24615(+) / protein_length=200 / sequence_SO=supercontig / SO=protein_coding / is_pseudo=false
MTDRLLGKVANGSAIALSKLAQPRLGFARGEDDRDSDMDLDDSKEESLPELQIPNSEKEDKLIQNFQEMALLSSAPASPPSLGPSEDAPAPEPSSSCGVSLVSGLPRSPRPAGVSSAWYLGGSSFLAVAFWFGGNVGGAEGTLLFYSCMACVMHVRRPDSFIESTGRCVRCSGCHFAGKALEIRRREIGGKGTKGCVGIP